MSSEALKSGKRVLNKEITNDDVISCCLEERNSEKITTSRHDNQQNWFQISTENLIRKWPKILNTFKPGLTKFKI